ncbi:unnamed protein product, partial [Meganyctiphanes norvegica]
NSSRLLSSEGLVPNHPGYYCSEEDLPTSVALCFEDPSLLARVQARLLTIIGRASRYHLQRGINSCSLLPHKLLRRKVKEARQRLIYAQHQNPATSSSTKDDTQSSCNTQSSTTQITQTDKCSIDIQQEHQQQQQQQHQHHHHVEMMRASAPLQQYWWSPAEGPIPIGVMSAEEEAEILQQYLALQQLAVARKHCNQLRRIRDSLAAREHHEHSPQPTSITEKGTECQRDLAPATIPQERQALRNFLMDIGFVQYYSLFNRHGYDLTTATHMDTLDLAAVGITEALHRMAIKYELDQAREAIVIPGTVPETSEVWLKSLGLPDYIDHFHQNNIYCPLAAIGLNKRDLQ